MGHSKIGDTHNADILGDDTAALAQTVKEQSRGGRWANLPPELRAIKDRWLGESSEEVLPLLVFNGAATTAVPTASTPALKGQQGSELRPQEPWSKTTPTQVDSGRVPSNVLVRVAASRYGNGGGRRVKEGTLPDQAAGESEEQWQGLETNASASDRVISADSLEQNPLLEITPRCFPEAEGRHVHHPREQIEEFEAYRNFSCQHLPQQHRQSPHLAEATAHDDSPTDKADRDTVSPQTRASRSTVGSATGEGVANGRCGGVEQVEKLPRTLKGHGSSLAPAFGDALDDPGGTYRSRNSRTRLRGLRSRLPCSTTGDAPSAVSPPTLNVHDRLAQSPPEGRPIRARVQPPSEGMAHAGADPDDGVCQAHRSRESRVRAGGSDRAQIRQQLEPAGEASSTKADEATGERLAGVQPADGALPGRGESTGTQRRLQHIATTPGDAAEAGDGATTGRVGRVRSDETTSTSSRQSELLDSLDLSVIPPPTGEVRTTAVAPATTTARQHPATAAVTSLMPRFQKNVDFKVAQIYDHAAVDPAVAAATTLTVETPASFPPQDEPPAKGAPAEVSASVRNRRTDAESQETAKLLLPRLAANSPPTAPPKAAAAKAIGKGINKFRDAPSVSRLRAPGWGREAAITPIPPAPAGAAATEADSSSAATSAADVHHFSPALTASAQIPWDPLTPVTEVATIDEYSVVSQGISTRGTVRMTPASSVTSGSRPCQGSGASGGARRECHRHAEIAAAAGVGAAACRCKSSPADTNGSANIDRDHQKNGGKKRSVWGSGIVSNGASAPGKGSAKPSWRDSRFGGAPTSLPACRSSPLSGNGDCVGERCSSFSSASAERSTGRQGGGGYVAAMSRRARSMARCEAARRLARRLAAERARPSTPISERTRWGKGRESHAEAERRKLLQRRAEYAEELKRKAKEDARALAKKKLAASTPPMLPADPRHVRAAAFANASPGDAFDWSMGGRNVPRVIEARGAHAGSPCGEAADDRQGKPLWPEHHFRSRTVAGGSGRGSTAHRTKGGAGAGGGERGVARGGQNPERQEAADGEPTEEDERQLMASIARLDNLLRKGDGSGSNAPRNNFDLPNAAPAGGGGSAQTQQVPGGRRMERKSARAPVGGIPKSRVRQGGRKEMKGCGSIGPGSAVAPTAETGHGVPLPAATSTADDNADAAASNGPALFPPLFSKVPLCMGPDESRGRSRYPPSDHEGAVEISTPFVQARPYVPASGFPGAVVASDGPHRNNAGGLQRRAVRKHDDRTDGTPDRWGSLETSQQAAAPDYWDGGDVGRGAGGERGPSRYSAGREGAWIPPTPHSSERHRDATHGNAHDEWHDCNGRGRRYRVGRAAPADERLAWKMQAERGYRAEEPQLDPRRERGYAAFDEWDRRDGGHNLPTHPQRR